MALIEVKSEIEGFQFNSYGPDLVAQILVTYLAGASYEAIPTHVSGTCSAQAQRIVVEAVKRGIIPPEAKRPKGRPSIPLEIATNFAKKHLEESAEYIAAMTDVGIATAFRARSIARKEAGFNKT